jgi:hypothetical protein
MIAAGIEDGRLLRSVSKSGEVNRDTLSDWAVWSAVEQSSKQIGQQAIQSATNKSERFNEFVQWISFGGDNVIAENVRDEQRKFIKYKSLGCKYFGLPQHRLDDKGDRSTEGGRSGNIRRGPGGRQSLSNVAHQPLWAIPTSRPADSRSTTVPPQAPESRNRRGGFARFGRCRLIQCLSEDFVRIVLRGGIRSTLWNIVGAQLSLQLCPNRASPRTIPENNVTRSTRSSNRTAYLVRRATTHVLVSLLRHHLVS